jgi:hypothetical protein
MEITQGEKMKKLLIVLLAIAIPMCANAVTLQWQHSGENTDGFIIRFWQAEDAATVYNYRTDDSTAREMVIGDERFEPNVMYRFVGTAYNHVGESENSNIVEWTRVVETYQPPANNLPAEVFLVDPEPVILTIGE